MNNPHTIRLRFAASHWRQILLAIAMFVCLGGLCVQAAENGHLVPINELGAAKYQGFTGGLYADGKNEPSEAQAEALRRMSAQVRPLNRDGQPDSQGKIVLAGIGASVCRQIFSVLEQSGPQTARLNPAVTMVNCALGGQDVNKIADPSERYWNQVKTTLEERGLSPAQVQVVWYQSDDLKDVRDDFPGRPQRLLLSLGEQMRLLKQHFPNLRLCYHSARHTTAFIPTDANAKKKHGEPRPYHVGWSVKWLIEEQSAGQGNLKFEGSDAVAPLVAWSTYFWTDGDTPRADGYRWTRDDNVKDGVHLTLPAQQRVAKELVEFWLHDPFAKTWFGSTPVATAPTTATKFRKDAGPNEPAWIVNGQNKILKLERLLATTDNVRVIVRDLTGKQVAEIKDVFSKHTDLNQLVGAGQYRLEFFNKDGQPIQKTQEVGEVLRLK